MIEIKKITKCYAPIAAPALKQISFTVRNCKIYGLLGPKGAGKTTILDIIAGVLPPTEGTVLINGYDILNQPKDAKRQIGYLPEEPMLCPDMTPYEYLSFIAEAKGVKGELRHAQVKEAIALLGLISVQDRLMRHFSESYRRKVGLAATLIGNPDLILLDEPCEGLDARQTMEVLSLIRRLASSKTVIITGHILSDMISLCDHIILFSDGRVVADGAPETLIETNPDLEELFATLTRQANEVPTIEYEDNEHASTEISPDELSDPEDETDDKEGQ